MRTREAEALPRWKRPSIRWAVCMIACWGGLAAVRGQTGAAAAPAPATASPAAPGTAPVATSGYLFGALVRATNGALDESAKVLDEALTGRLGESFSFAHFQLLGQHTQPVSAEYEAWVLPSEELYMKVDSKGPVDGGLGLHLQLWRRENVILKTDVILNPGSPIFIAGPKWGEDQLVFVIQLREQP